MESPTMMSPVSAPTQPLPQIAVAAGGLRISAEEFLRWEHQGIAEWVNGEVITVSVKEEHQKILQFLYDLLAPFVRLFNLGIIQLAPYAMRIRADGAVREPDLTFVLAANASRITPSALEGPADLVIEVVSDGSVVQDYDAKYIEYQNGGVREYWIIDPRQDRLRTSFFVLDAQNHYRAVPLGDDGVYRSTVLSEFWFKTDWLWQNPQPPVDDLLLEIGGELYLQRLVMRARERGMLAQ
ncbi:MAG: Uma2 family endonuclease [Chloroflexi bacterium]|nr:Uma2 family endonuclease [Chloroflexota bacterium]